MDLTEKEIAEAVERHTMSREEEFEFKGRQFTMTTMKAASDATGLVANNVERLLSAAREAWHEAASFDNRQLEQAMQTEAGRALLTLAEFYPTVAEGGRNAYRKHFKRGSYVDPYRAALEMLLVGLTGHSTPNCEYYDGIAGDAADEAADLLNEDYGREEFERWRT